MTSEEELFRERWRRDRPVYEAWGEFVCRQMEDGIASKITPLSVKLFFRIPISWRTKEEDSLYVKAFHKGKNYRNPYDDIEDKVGLRIVVLVSDEIRLVEEAIIQCTLWSWTKARDFEVEKSLKPYEFDYQSLHYVVRAAADIPVQTLTIPRGTPCEIQVRTLLQHAYSELTHDTIYKPTVQANADVKRAAAKSMALIEATDDYFKVVKEKLKKAQVDNEALDTILGRIFSAYTGLSAAPSSLNSLVVDFYKKFSTPSLETDLAAFLTDKPYLVDVVKKRAPDRMIYQQPGIFLVYWAIKHHPHAAAEGGPLTESELAPLYSDLGLRLPDP